MKRSRQLFLALTSGILIALAAGCSTDKPVSGGAEKISFPTINFTISANTDTTIFGDKETRIFISKGTFQFADGTPVTDSITLELKEFYNKSDIVLADLSTQSGDKLLETGGMLNITATSQGKKIEIKSDKRIVVHFPKSKNSYKKMDLFYADKTATDSSVTSWDVDTINLVKKTLKLGSFGWWHPADDDSTGYEFIPKNFVDTGYYWNPLDLYISAYNFSTQTKNEIETTMNKNTYPDFESWNDYGVECETHITVGGRFKNAKVVTKVSAAAKKEILSFLYGLPELRPGTDKNGKIIERRGLLFIQGGNVIPLYKTNEEYLKSFNTKYAKYEKTPIKNMDAAELDYYVFSVSKLGWINCDRFLDAAKTTDFIVQSAGNEGAKLKMVFSDVDGVLMPVFSNGNYVFSNVPIGSQVTIIAIKNTGGQLQTAFQNVTINEKPLQNLTYKETTLAELKKELGKLN
jgi:hypothetical protein